MSELEAVLGLAPSATVTLAGEAVEVRPLTLRQVGPFARAMAPLDGVDLGDIMAVVRPTEEVVEAVAIATGRDREWLWGLSPVELITLAGIVVEVNARFFGATLLPALTQAAARIEQALAGPR
jgi:hypothetical protein